MQPLPPTLSSVLWLPVAGGLFLLPGWLLARWRRAPTTFVAAFLASGALLFNAVLVFDALRVPLHRGTMALGFALPAAVFAWCARRTPFAFEKPPRPPLPRGTGWLWLLPPAFAFASIATRVLIDPLSGYDNGFRWDYLGRLVLAQQSLASYPPVTATQFEYYGWCDGIPPLGPLLNFWIYAVTGSVAPALIAVRVLGETLLLGTVVFRYSRLLWGERAGFAAVAALSSSALALWSEAMSQETGLTALSLVAMLYFLELHRRENATPLLFWAGLAGGVGAIARDYALAFPLLGLGLVVARKPGRTPVLVFAATSAAVAAPWYGRNWIKTGNPLYPQTLGGLFPGNAVHDAFMGYISDFWSFGAAPHSPWYLLLLLLALGGLLLALAGIGAGRQPRRHLPILLGVALTTALWLGSIPQTAAGWEYSARVLLPALALAAVLAGWSATCAGRFRTALALGLSLSAADAARRSWLLPDFPFATPWSVSFAPWQKAHRALQDIGANPVWKILALNAAGRGIVVDHPSHHALLTAAGGTAVPFFSPLLAPTFAASPGFDATLAQLRAENIRFVALSLNSILTLRLVQAHPFWAEFCRRYAPNAQAAYVSIYDLDRLQPQAPR